MKIKVIGMMTEVSLESGASKLKMDRKDCSLLNMINSCSKLNCCIKPEKLGPCLLFALQALHWLLTAMALVQLTPLASSQFD